MQGRELIVTTELAITVGFQYIATITAVMQVAYSCEKNDRRRGRERYINGRAHKVSFSHSRA
jgi:hypothetical protein